MSQRDGLRLGYKREWCGAGLQGQKSAEKPCRDEAEEAFYN